MAIPENEVTTAVENSGSAADRALPADLLHAIAHEGGGRVVLVVGAGVSIEPPTDLPPGSRCASDAYRRLIEDSIIESSACSNPDDLSAVADAVFATTGKQAELVRRLPVERFISAAPNQGHSLAAALLRERAISSVLTLNFDLALTTALANVGAAEDVSQIRGPEEQERFGSHNLVYLHRTANHDPEAWILRTEMLNSAWTDNWEEAIASRVLTAPVVVFAGLGSPAAVLTETTHRLRSILQNGVKVFQVDPAEREQSFFAGSLGIEATDYIQIGWVDFMQLLSRRLLIEQLEKLKRACEAIRSAHNWPEEDLTHIRRAILAAGLLHFGAVRARWMLEDAPYLPAHACDVDHVADLASAIALIERVSGTSSMIGEDGVVEFWEGALLRAVVVVASARGKWRWGSIEPRVMRAQRNWRIRSVEVRKAIVAGAPGDRAEITPPESILGSSGSSDIVRGPTAIQFYDLDQLREADAHVTEMINA